MGLVPARDPGSTTDHRRLACDCKRRQASRSLWSPFNKHPELDDKLSPCCRCQPCSNCCTTCTYSNWLFVGRVREGFALAIARLRGSLEQALRLPKSLLYRCRMLLTSNEKFSLGMVISCFPGSCCPSYRDMQDAVARPVGARSKALEQNAMSLWIRK